MLHNHGKMFQTYMPCHKVPTLKRDYKTVDNYVNNLWKTEDKTQGAVAGVKKE